MLLEDNMGEYLSIDETLVHDDLLTFLTNKEGHCRHGSLIASVKGTKVGDVTGHLMRIPEEKRLAVKEVTMDFSDSMMGIVSNAFPNAKMTIDCFHVIQLATRALDEMRMKLKRAARTEQNREEREFKEQLKRRSKSRERYARDHEPKKSKHGKTLGRPRKRKNERFVPRKLGNGETKPDLLTRVRYPLMKAGIEWSKQQKERMDILFGLDRRIKAGYGLVCALRNIFRKRQDRKQARKALKAWGKNVGKSLIRELIAVRDTIMGKLEYVLNYFDDRSTNAYAESFNSKIKAFRTQVHGVADLPFFMYRLVKIFG